MPIKLKKKYFVRNRDREEEFGSIFNKASTSIYLLNIIIAGIFAPAVIIPSLVSKDLLLMLANIFLSAGYATNFVYRLYSKEISTSELFITSVCLAFIFLITFHFFPAITTWNLINTISFINYSATIINGFFLARNIIIPPCKRLLEHVALSLGFPIGGRYFYRKDLSDDLDRFALDRLFRKHYKHDLSGKGDHAEKIAPFNNMLNKLTEYINKYNENLLGSVYNSGSISKIEDLIKQLTLDGKTTNCIDFIERKINFKRTKITLLKEAKATIDTITLKEDFDSVKQKLKFFQQYQSSRINTDRANLVKEASESLSNEIHRQEIKLKGSDDNDVIGLEECLPITNASFKV